MLPNLSNAALLGILWVTRLFTKSDLCHMLGIPIFNVRRWPLESFPSIPVCWIICFFCNIRVYCNNIFSEKPALNYQASSTNNQINSILSVINIRASKNFILFNCHSGLD